MRTIRITGTGSALPGRIVTNKELEQMVETSDEWIRERTGIGERHVSVGETVVTLASEAARKALEQAGKERKRLIRSWWQPVLRNSICPAVPARYRQLSAR